ncbi:LysE family translocator [Streptomyces sp. NPDC001135]
MIAQGRRAGLISLMGIAVGFLVYLAAAIAGNTTVFTLVPALYTTIQIAGVAYLLWLAWKTVRPGGVSAFDPQALPVDRPRKLLTMGMGTTLLNPEIAIMYVSLLPQFVNPARGHVATQSLTRVRADRRLDRGFPAQSARVAARSAVCDGRRVGGVCAAHPYSLTCTAAHRTPFFHSLRTGLCGAACP